MRKEILVQHQHTLEFSWSSLFDLAHIYRQFCFPGHSELTILSCKVYKSLLSPCGIQNNAHICRKCRLHHTIKIQGRNFMEQKATSLCFVLKSTGFNTYKIHPWGSSCYTLPEAAPTLRVETDSKSGLVVISRSISSRTKLGPDFLCNKCVLSGTFPRTQRITVRL